MNNKMLSAALVLSTLIIPQIASARLSNEVISHTGILSIPGANSIKLEQRAGRSINLNKGYLEIKTTRVPMGFSLLDPQLTIKQNGQTLVLDVDTDSYSGEENFTLLSKDSGLNYDLYLRKTTTNSNELSAVKVQACTYQEFGLKCGIDVSGAYNCVSGMMDRPGVQQVRTTTIDITDTYRLTLGQKNVGKAEFTSAKTRTEIKSTEELSRCK